MEDTKINHFHPKGGHNLVGTEECGSTQQACYAQTPICQSYARNTKICMGSAMNHEHTITPGRSGTHPNSSNTEPSARSVRTPE